MAKYYNDLAVFVAVAREGSFTKAAAKLNVSQSALSQTIKNLEERLGLRLLARTSRNISTTEAGEKLLTSLSSHFEEIDAELDALTHLRDRPAGRIAITSSQHAADTILWPVLEKFLGEYPDVKIEVIVDATMVDLVAERFDAGVRLGEQIEKDMIAMRIGPDLRMAVVGSPSYFDKHGRPEIPEDLTRHNCTNIRMPTFKRINAWEFEKGGKTVNVRVDGQAVFNSGSLRMNAALAGVGLSYMLEDYAKPYIDDGRLVRVLEDWCEPFAGYHLYYPSRRQHSPAFVLLLNALRYRE
ncbi:MULTISPECIES: LysR family transcriptional regulator [Rhizobium]|uniref:LysR family transcriptional regulator n=1 Tax=Rhizobium TaxID=379 RepID=UPI0014423874|nr:MULTISPECIES: LysR family transcriptional regulator [Rhizobium]MBY3039679.1 LysR family transcriptional regulator [Rhizobium laguerreae]MBY3117162.1 LysR family transcriptional regulator [Rhizobium laguerreae]MBY3132626.1 LysR family transcriptional regulator [Rhizobium laguerreae]MBY3172476.1 LysR family transcriptional regulator [Rhizobium laguerreae]MBY3189752.1 LysR family transcriptional regulator [Rhizobium laguerreae]